MSNNTSVRWGRGFFRAWVVVSVIWVCLSVLIFHSEVKYKIPEFPLHIGKGPIKFSASEQFYEKTRVQQQELVDGIISEKPDPQRDHDSAKNWPTEADRNNWHLDNKIIVWNSIPFVVGVAIFPPIIVLFLGAMAGWALLGFKDTP